MDNLTENNRLMYSIRVWSIKEQKYLNQNEIESMKLSEFKSENYVIMTSPYEGVYLYDHLKFTYKEVYGELRFGEFRYQSDDDEFERLYGYYVYTIYGDYPFIPDELEVIGNKFTNPCEFLGWIEDEENQRGEL